MPPADGHETQPRWVYLDTGEVYRESSEGDGFADFDAMIASLPEPDEKVGALIATAPELLEALKALIALRDRGFTKAVAASLGLEVEAAISNTWIEIPYRRARAAIAKAEQSNG